MKCSTRKKTNRTIRSMDENSLNVEVFRKICLSIGLIRQVPSGLKVDVFTRCLSRKHFSRSECLIDEDLRDRQEKLLFRLDRTGRDLTKSFSSMDFCCSQENSNSIRFNDEFQFGNFAEKIRQIKWKNCSLRLSDLEFLFNFIEKFVRTSSNVDHRTLPVDAFLFSIQILTNSLQFDNGKVFIPIFEILPFVERLIELLVEQIERVQQKLFNSFRTMLLSLGELFLLLESVLGATSSEKLEGFCFKDVFRYQNKTGQKIDR